MAISEVSLRYAKAIFEIAVDQNSAELTLAQLRKLQTVFFQDEQITEFICSPVISAEQKQTIIKAALEKGDIQSIVKDFTLLLAQKNRLTLFAEIVEAFESLADNANKVTRGVVTSATLLGPAERKSIESTISKALGKGVILSYKEDHKLLGGLVAKVGSYTFDDTIDTHLNRLKEELNRRSH